VSFALVGSWDPRWIADHEEWLRRGGPHRDGWMVKLTPAAVHCLREQIRTEGFFRFYAYAARGKGGDGFIHRAFHVSRFVSRAAPAPFKHDRGRTHHDVKTARANAVFTYADVEAFAPPRRLAGFTTIVGKPLGHPSGLLSVPCVQDF
jgi:hypothetical protein